MEELETLEGTECPECPGPPPEFRLPPPPRPPFLTEGTFCSEAPLAELEDCVAIPMIDASYHTNPSLQSTALIITSAVILLLMAAIISVVFWKHKRKVQNLLPCKSAAGAATSASSRTRGGGVLGEGQGVPVGSGSVLYEDLQDAVSHVQHHTQVQNHFGNHLHHHHHLHHHQSNNPAHAQQQQHQQQQQQQQQQHHLHHRPIQPTIEVREIPEAVIATQRTPAPHHLDYLDYRDPRAILRVADKPSRAVLGGYRTPRALLAKSQGVPFAMVNQNPQPQLTPTQQPQNHLNNQNNIVSNNIVYESINNRQNHMHNNYYHPVNDNLRRVTLNEPITPTHRPRLRTPTDISPVKLTSTTTPARNFNKIRRPSVDSEGYSFIDFYDAGVSNVNNEENIFINDRSNSIDSDGYSYIDVINTTNTSITNNNNNNNNNNNSSSSNINGRRTSGSTRRVIVSGEGATDEEVCPLCTVQRIHGLLSRPEDYYSGIGSPSGDDNRSS